MDGADRRVLQQCRHCGSPGLMTLPGTLTLCLPLHHNAFRHFAFRQGLNPAEASSGLPPPTPHLSLDALTIRCPGRATESQRPNDQAPAQGLGKPHGAAQAKVKLRGRWSLLHAQAPPPYRLPYHELACAGDGITTV